MSEANKPNDSFQPTPGGRLRCFRSLLVRRVLSAFGISMNAPIYPMFVAMACALISCTGRPGDGREGGSDKIEWSILQSMKAPAGPPIHEVEFVEVNGYHIVCVPRDGDQTRVWIMMDPKSPPFYKQLPSGNYWLTEDQIENIRKRTNPISTVLQALESHKKAK